MEGRKEGYGFFGRKGEGAGGVADLTIVLCCVVVFGRFAEAGAESLLLVWLCF